MSTVTDPIADLLARVRNAAAAQKQEMFVPYSKIKAEIIRILKEEGYITDYVLDNERGASADQDYEQDVKPYERDHGFEAGQSAGTAALRGREGNSPRPWRDGHFDSFYSARNSVWSRSEKAKRGRRAAGLHLVGEF